MLLLEYSVMHYSTCNRVKKAAINVHSSCLPVSEKAESTSRECAKIYYKMLNGIHTALSLQPPFRNIKRYIT